MPNTGNTQQIINYGATANDGTGDPLRTAFIKTDENFDNVWLAGPVGSNITIGNNTIQTNNTNGNIIIKPNGTGVIQANASIIPNSTGTRDLGSNALSWRRAYIDELLPSTLTVSGDASIGGNLTIEGDTIQIGNITGNTGGFAIGYRDIPQVTFSANATAALTDAGKHYYSTTAGNLQLTLPDNVSVAIPTGATLTIVVNAAGNVLVGQGTGVTLYQAGSATTGNRVVGAYGLATVMKVAANTWVISGTGVY